MNKRPFGVSEEPRTAISGPPTSVVREFARTEVSPFEPDSFDTAALDAKLVPGARVAQFELIRELGRGGMGRVFRARDTRLGRLVAIKFLALAGRERTERFLVEARATARCQHENIVVIHEVGEWDGHPYMVLEYLEGEPLSVLAQQGGVSPRRAVEIAAPVLRALQRAHEHNIVHRDLKPDNVFITRDGAIKVLDFGIARLFERDPVGGAREGDDVVGTLPYMAPEQWGGGTVDHRADLWALGVVLWEVLVGRHPLAPLSSARLMHMAAHLDEPMPRIGTARSDLPPELEAAIDQCLAKRKADRPVSADAVAAQLELLLPGRFGARSQVGASPYPGLAAFQETDASRFFGRSRDVRHVAERLRSEALVALIGASGVGKSSLVRAGLVPHLKAGADPWEVLVMRPGRDPMSSLAGLVAAVTQTRDRGAPELDIALLADRLRREPGALGALLRQRAGQKRGQILVFVDQFEELYTLESSPEQRRAFTACLCGVADDASSPVRVVLSMRSDFLDRAAEDRLFMERLTRGLVVVPPMDREGLLEALLEPAEQAGYRFESRAMAEAMISELDGAAGALPLLQFTAARLWEGRDRSRHLLTHACYESLGGVAGALACHADDVLAGMSVSAARLTRAIFERLVTTDDTRAIVEVVDLAGLSSEPGAVAQVIDQLVAARLLAVQSVSESGQSVEVVHESLIASWPTLRRWLDESSEDAAFIAQLRAAAKQWDQRGRSEGLLWRGDQQEEAARFARRYEGTLSQLESDFLGAVQALASRALRRRRRALVAAFATLLALVAAAGVALIWVRNAEQSAQEQKLLAQEQAKKAKDAEAQARQERDAAEAARLAEAKANEDFRRASAAVQERDESLAEASTNLDVANQQLRKALDAAERARLKAESEARAKEQLAEAERRSRKEAEALAAEKDRQLQAVKKELSRLSTRLK